MVHVFIVGSKGIPAKYGGFETFVENLTARKESKNIKYHVSCMDNLENNFVYNNAQCFGVRVPFDGALGRIAHVDLVLYKVEKWCRENLDEQVIVYILGCRIGPLIILHSIRFHRLGIAVYCNPDGLEWKRRKWNYFERKILKYCESCLVRYTDLAICDSEKIEEYIKAKYSKKETTYIAYGADIIKSKATNKQIENWYIKNCIHKKQYYLVVGRFVPENNFEKILLEFMLSGTDKDLVIITDIKDSKFYNKLLKATKFETDSRIKFVGTVYDSELLKRIREEAYAYIHGHEVGGTNPSLLESLASTKLNLVLDVEYNREVANDGALYWNKVQGNLSEMINYADSLSVEYIDKLNAISLMNIHTKYEWDYICKKYERVFLEWTKNLGR